MDNEIVPVVGAKDLQDFKGLSRSPEIGYLQKQSLPPAPRDQPASPATTVFQKLKRFAATDYVRWITQYLQHRIGRKHPFPTYDSPAIDDGIYPLIGDGDSGDDVVRIAIAGDWGTGTDEAFTVAMRMEARWAHYTVHLGDVYFVGSATEVKENFLGIPNEKHNYTPCTWPRGAKGAFALNGNHEMYALGKGYFDLMLPALGMRSAGKGKPQKASYFCLENDFWRVIALDTGYNSLGFPIVEQFIPPNCALPEPLLCWLRDVLRQSHDKRGILLLSHHQYFSSFDDWYLKPAEQLAEFIDRPVIWLWGHEHRLAIYDKHQFGNGITAYGRCIGHGGMPVDLPPKHPRHLDCPAEFVDHRKYANKEGLTLGFNGFAALTFERDTLKIDYVDVEDTLVFSETWETDAAGQVSRVKFWALEAAANPPPALTA